MRTARLAAVASLAVWALACGTPPPTTLTVDPQPASLNVAPGAYVTLTITGTFQGKPLLEDSEITLDTDEGTFVEGEESQSTTATIKGQKATVKLFSPEKLNTAQLVATVHAKYVDPYAVTVNAEAKVTFKTKTKAVKLNFSCTSRNIGAFWDGIPEMRIRCRAEPEDENNEFVTGTKVMFLAEAGEFSPLEDDPGAFVYTPRVGNRLPKDVAPLGDDATGEPRYVDQSAPGSPTRNPRDGLVTLVAYIEGESNGVYSTPYVDANDNDKYDAGEDLAPGNPEYQDEQDRYIWKQVKILWTGRTHENLVGTRVTGDVAPLARGEARTFTWTILDINLNIPAANSETDTVSWDDPAYGAYDLGAVRALHSMGIDMDSNFKIRNPTKRETYTRDAAYPVTIRNTRAADDTEGDQNVAIVGHIVHNIATDETGAAESEWDEALPSAHVILK